MRARIGQKNGLVRQWARRGTRPRQTADQRYDNAYLFGAICPARGVGAVLVLPYADTDMMQLHLDEISRNVAKGAHAVVLLDRAGWHITSKLDRPENITPIFLPSRAPELNPVENVWQMIDGRDGLANPGDLVRMPMGLPHPIYNKSQRLRNLGHMTIMASQARRVVLDGFGGNRILSAQNI